MSKIERRADELVARAGEGLKGRNMSSQRLAWNLSRMSEIEALALLHRVFGASWLFGSWQTDDTRTLVLLEGISASAVREMITARREMEKR